MDPLNVLEDSGSRHFSTQEADGDFRKHHLTNLATSSKGDNRTLETDEKRNLAQGDFHTSQIDLTTTTDFTTSEYISFAASEDSRILQNISQYSAPFDDNNSSDVFMSESTSSENTMSSDISTEETFHQHKSLYNIMSEELQRNSFLQQDLTAEPVTYYNDALKQRVTEGQRIMFSGIEQVPDCNVSSDQYLLFGDILNCSQLHIRSKFTENFSESASNDSWLYGVNATLVYKKSLNSIEQTSFNFDLTSWLTLTSSDSSELTGSSDTILILKVLLLAIIALVGAIGNVMVICSVVKERHLHRPPFYFLLSLGVTDLSRAVFCVPVVITTVLHGSRWRHGESACKLFAFATSFFVFSSALSLLAIAIDRHISVVYSKTYRRRAPGIANLIAAIIIWVIAFSVTFPPVVGVGDYVFIPDESQCTYQHKHYTHSDSAAFVFIFLAILLSTYFLYFRIFCFLRSHRRMRPLQHTPAVSSSWAFVGPGANGQAFINWLNGFGGQVPARQAGQRAVQRLNFGRVINLSTAKNEHLTRLFLIMTSCFGFTWLPYAVVSLWRTFFDASLLPSSCVTASAWLGYGQLAVCPVVYFMARGPAKKPTRTVYSQPEKRNFLLENKMGK